MQDEFLIVDAESINKSLKLATTIEQLKANGVNVEVIEEPDTKESDVEHQDIADAVEQIQKRPAYTSAQDWYDSRLRERLDKSRYYPHQGEQECARRVRQMERNHQRLQAVEDAIKRRLEIHE